MATIISTELDGTNGTLLTVANSGGLDNKSGNWTFDTAVKASGTASVRLDNLDGDTGALTKNHPGAVSVRYYDFCGRLSTFGTSDTIIAQTRTGASNKAQVMLNTDGTFRIRNLTTTVDTSSTVATINQFFRLQWGISGTIQTLRIWVATTPAMLFTTTADEELIGAYTQDTWDLVRFGMLTANPASMWLDRIIVDDSTWPASGGVGNAPPTANAGSDQTVNSGATVTLNGTGSADSDGTIASYAWTQTGGSAVTLSSSTTASPTFTAPTVAVTSVLSFGLRVTDNDGAQSTQNTVDITVNPVGTTPTDDFFELFNGPVGTTITTSNTDLDTVDAGFTFTADAIGEGDAAALGVSTGGVIILTHILPAGMVSERYADTVFQILNVASGPYFIYRAVSSGTIRATVRVNVDGTLNLRNGTTVVGSTSTAAVVSGQPFRVAWHLENGVGQELRLFTGANLWGTVANSGGSISGTFNTGTFDRIGVGIGAPATAGTITVDAFRINAADWPEPLGAPPPAEANIFLVESDGSGGTEYTPMTLNIL